jgi:hypothetical protein
VPGGGTFNEPVSVELVPDVEGTPSRYTLDGSAPTASSPLYGGPIMLTESAELLARAFPADLAPSQTSSASFVIDPHAVLPDGPRWSVYDSPGGEPAASKWQVADGVVTEVSNYHVPVPKEADLSVERPGTFRIHDPLKELADGELSLELNSSDNDVLGVAFRFGGPDRYYVWAMERQRGYHVLACKSGDTYRLLASNDGSYEPNRWYQLRVVLAGPKITVYIDGQKDLEATDATHAGGTFAFYTWGCGGAKFRRPSWKQ